MFKHLGLAIALTGLLGAVAPAPAEAADNLSVVKAAALTAPAPTTCSVTGCTGIFLGGEISGSGTGINVLNLGSLTQNGTFMGVNGGYQFYNGTYWFGALAHVEYQLASPNSSLTPSLSNVFAFEGFEVGGQLAALFPSVSAITLSGPLAGAVPTVKIGACQHGSLQGYCAGAAAHFFVPNSKWTIDATYLNAQYTSGNSLSGTANVTTENRGIFGATYHF